ncbi:hypothetical protein KAR91_81750 [Candidatus Pacearchaeota archaeon]|nr:hypothetical protein [Candidatus Pacearchaeota archaeon]
MPKYKVKYSYHGQGMELGPDIKDYGIVEAESENGAKDIVVLAQLPEDIFYGPNNKWSSREFLRNCLTAIKT